jgi:hypothetical protein
MQPSGMGRNCTHCQKTVIDFTHWSDAALYEFFAKSETRVCGRFLKTQVDRTITIPHQPHSKLYRLTIALGLTLIFAQTPDALAHSRPPQVRHSIADGHKGHRKPAPQGDHKPKTYTITGYRKPLVPDEGTQTIMTGEVEARQKKEPDSLHEVVAPAMPVGRKHSTANDIKLDSHNPTKRVLKRE